MLLFSFGTPLMPVDRHVERVSKRIGLMPPKATADEGHEQWLAMLEPDQMYAAHVGHHQPRPPDMPRTEPGLRRHARSRPDAGILTAARRDGPPGCAPRPEDLT